MENLTIEKLSKVIENFLSKFSIEKLYKSYSKFFLIKLSKIFYRKLIYRKVIENCV